MKKGLFPRGKGSRIGSVNGTLSASSFSCFADRQNRRPGRSRAAFRKIGCSAKRAYWPVNTPVPARARTTTLGPFGEVIRQTGPMAKANTFRFSTKYQDDETGLNYYGYRYYDPSTGRWPSRDPIEERGGLNIYTFAVNSPQNQIDELGLTISDAFKDWGYHFWRDNFVTAPEWREVMDDWYYERGPNPAYFVGNSDRRNAWIAINTGFRHLLNCWVAAQRGDAIPQSSEWTVRKDGFWWHYGYWGFLGVGNSAGGSAAYDSATHFLGSYDAKVSLASSDGKTDTLAIDVYNRSHWVSGTRTEGIPLVGAIIKKFGQGAVSLLSDHERGMGPEKPSSRGGNMDQHYIFTIKVPHCAKCVLP
ncbi:MAG: RHS repeat-associated core domain-containing protein [Negativicutes bacterium]|nr:RHS repeat-associated core domain-containing protein [Negativicutes bacterium]